MPEGTVANPSRLSTSLSPKLSSVPLPPVPAPAAEPPHATATSHLPHVPHPHMPHLNHHSPHGHVSAASGHVSNVAAEKLYHFIARPRSRCIDFGTKDGASGTTVLHEAVKRKDLGIVKLVISKGGDVLARDRKGKLPVDLAKDERVKNVLRQGAS